MNSAQREGELIASVSRHALMISSLITGLQTERGTSANFLACTRNCTTIATNLNLRRETVDGLIVNFTRSRFAEYRVDEELISASKNYDDNISLLKVSLPEFRLQVDSFAVGPYDAIKFYTVFWE